MTTLSNNPTLSIACQPTMPRQTGSLLEANPRRTATAFEQVVGGGGDVFFLEEGWRDTLRELSSQYWSRHQRNGRWESEEEYQTRVRYEIGASKEIIEARLRKRVSFLCWPGGAYDEMTERIAEEAGYLSTTLSSGDPRRSREDPGHITRFWVPLIQVGNRALYRNGRYLVCMLHCKQGSKSHCLACKLLSARDRSLSRLRVAMEAI